MDTKELIQSIIASEEDAGDKFLESMEERISDALEVRKVELASGMMDEALKPEFEYDPNDPNASGNEMKTIQKHTYKVPKGLKPQFDTPVSRYKMLRKAAKMKEEVEQVDEGDLSIRTLYNKYADHYASSNGAARADAVEKAITKVHGPTVMGHLKKAVKANLRTDFDGEGRHFDRARTAAEKSGSDRVGATVGRGRSKFRKEEVEQVNEISARKAITTAVKREAGAANAAVAAGDEIDPRSAKKIENNTARIKNRYGPRGIDIVRRGVNAKTGYQKTANEEVEQIDEWRYREVEQQQRRIARGMSPEESERRMKEVRDREDAARIKKRAAAKAAKKTNEDVEQVDEAKYTGLKPSTLASYAGKAARRIRSSTSLARGFDDEAATQRRRGNKEDAEANQSLSSEFQRSAKNRIRGIERASERLAREEVEQANEAITDMEKLRLMGDKNRAMTMMAMKRYQQVGDINKLSPAHRTLVTKYMQNQAGSLERVSSGMQRAVLKQSKE